MMSKPIQVALGLLLLVIQVQAQEVCTLSLSGSVQDEHNGEVLSFANLVLQETGQGATADSSGRFRFEGLCAGTYTLVSSHVGCDPVTQTVRLTQSRRVIVLLEHHSEWLEALQVVGKKDPEQVTANEQSLSDQEQKESTGQTLGESLKKLNGVNTLSTGNSIQKPVIHGLHSNRILVLNNGVRQEGQQWGSEHAPEIDPLLAGKLSVVKGAASVRYGPDAIGGVVLLEPPALRKTPGLGGKVQLAGFSNGLQGVASAQLEGNFRKVSALSWRVQGTLKKGGNVRTSQDYLENTGLEESNFSWAAAYQKERYGLEVFYSQFNTTLGIFAGAHIGNLSDLRKAFEQERPLDTVGFSYTIKAPYQQIEHELIKARGYLATGKAGRLELIYARQFNNRREFDSHGLFGRPREEAALNLNLTTHTADVLWKHNRIGSWKGQLGASFLQQDNTYRGRFFIPNYRKNGMGIFGLERWKPDSGSWEFEAGVRYDYIRQQVYLFDNNEVREINHDFAQFTATIGALMQLGNRSQLRTQLASSWRPPQVNEMYSDGLHHGAAAVEIGDTSLTEERAWSLNAGYTYEGKRLRIDWDVYGYYFDGFIYLKPGDEPTLTIRGAFPTFHYTQTDTWLTGTDLSLSYRFPGRLTYRTKNSLLRTWEATSGNYLVGMPADRTEHTLEYRLRNREKLREAYLAVTVLHVFKQSRVPANSDFAEPPAAYTLLNLQLGWELQIGKQPLSMGIGVHNLLNTAYRDYLNRFRYYADDLGTNVSFRISVPFNITANKQLKNNDENK